MQLNPGFKPGYIDDVDQKGEVYFAHVTTFNKENKDYTIQLKFTKDSLFIAPEGSEKYVGLCKGSKHLKYPNTRKFIKPLIGKWYSTDGKNELVMEITAKTIQWNNDEFEIQNLIRYDRSNTRQLNIQSETQGRFIHFGKHNGDYLSLNILGDKWHNLKRGAESPDLRSSDWDQVPESLIGEWYSCTSSEERFLVEKNYLTIGGQKHKMKQFKVEEQLLSVMLDIDGKGRRWYRFYEAENKYCSFDSPKGKGAFLRRSVNQPQGKVVDADFDGSWYNATTNNEQLTLNKGAATGMLNGTYKQILFDGIHYKYQTGNGEMLLIKKITDIYIEVKTANSKEYVLLKNNREATASIQLTSLDESLKKMWYSTNSGEWILKPDDTETIYDQGYWNNKAIEYCGNGQYKLVLEQKNVVCDYSEQGEELCRMQQKEIEMQCRIDNDGQLHYRVGDGEYQVLSTNFKHRNYDFDEEMPEWSTGNAVVRFQFLGKPDEIKGEKVTVSTNNAWFIDQIKVEEEFDEKGRAELVVPMSAPQPVFLRCLGYTSIMLFPNDTIMIGIPNKKNNVYWEWLHSGTGNQINRELLYVSRKYVEFLNKPENKAREKTALTPDQFKDDAREVVKRFEEFYQANFKDQQSTPAIEQLFKTKSKVLEWDMMMDYSNARQRIKGKALSPNSDFYSFLYEIDLTNKEFWYSENFAWFLNDVRFYAMNLGRGERPNYRFPEIIPEVVPDLLDHERELLKTIDGVELKEINGKRVLDHDLAFRKKYWSEVRGLAEELKKTRTDNTYYWDARIAIVEKHRDSIGVDISAGLIEYCQTSKANVDSIAALIDKYNAVVNKYIQEKQKASQLAYIPGPSANQELFKKCFKLNEYTRAVDKLDMEDMSTKLDEIKTLKIEPSLIAYCKKEYDRVEKELAKPMPGECHIADMVDMKSCDELLQMLKTKYKGKVVYLDIWAPWCSPCRGEMAKADRFKKLLKDEKIAWVYLCGSGDKTAWENCIKTYKAVGDHYYLPKNVYGEFCNKYEVSGIPRFMIIDKKGRFVVEKAGRPSGGPTTAKQLKKYL